MRMRCATGPGLSPQRCCCRWASLLGRNVDPGVPSCPSQWPVNADACLPAVLLLLVPVKLRCTSPLLLPKPDRSWPVHVHLWRSFASFGTVISPHICGVPGLPSCWAAMARRVAVPPLRPLPTPAPASIMPVFAPAYLAAHVLCRAVSPTAAAAAPPCPCQCLAP